MVSVTQRIAMVRQPRGGYLNPKDMVCTRFDDGITLGDENISPSIIGVTVDYLTRLGLGEDRPVAFSIPLAGAMKAGLYPEAFSMLCGISGTDDGSISLACKMTYYDTYFRTGRFASSDPSTIVPDRTTCENIRTMVRRSIKFLNSNGPLVSTGFGFNGGYTDIVDAGDGDYLTHNAIWDLKVSKNNPTSKHTLQILMYYLMGIHTQDEAFGKVTRIGLYNPRLNRAYHIRVSKLDPQMLKLIETDVIGYRL